MKLKKIVVQIFIVVSLMACLPINALASGDADTYAILSCKANGHTFSEQIPKVERTCTQDGMQAHYRCTVCQKYFVEKNGEKVATSAASLKIEAGHNCGKLIEQKDATCTTDGLREHYQCQRCKKYFVDVDGQRVEILKEDLVIPAAGHTYSDLVPRQEKTCTQDGMRAHYRCTVCEKYFIEKNGEKVATSAASLKIPAAAHSYSDLIPQKDPTTTESGMMAHYLCVSCNQYFVEVDGQMLQTTQEDLIISPAVSVYSETGIFFSSHAQDGGDGSFERPYNDLGVLSSLDIQAGAYIYLERGSLFYGSLVLSGISGSEDAPVVVTAYGEGDLPKIDGNDLTGSAVVYIENCSNLIVEELEIYDSAVTEGDRRGVLIVCDNNIGTQEVITYKNIILRNLYIHDIRGFMDAENSGMAISSKKTGGIHLWSSDGFGRIDGLTITGCRITDVSNVGIATWYRMRNKTVIKISPYTDEFADYAHLNVRIADNEISYIGKNAIYARHLYGGVIEHNVIHDTAIGCVSGNTIVTSYVDGTVIQYNEGYRNMARARASDGKLYDGCMLDADLASKDTVWQYNYSHDNAFGLFMNCTKSEDTVIVRYNLSVNDHGANGIIFINYASSGIYVYNNTIVTGFDTEYILQSNDGRSSFFYNNLIYNRSANARFEVDASSGMEASHNLIYNEYGSNISAMSFFHSINEDGISGEDPLFAGHLQEDSILGIENLHGFGMEPNSPALDSGKTMDAAADFFGNAYTESIGFYCGP